MSVADLRLPLVHPDASFDFVLCNAVIQHIAPDTVLGVTLPGFARLLKAGGVLQLMFKVGTGIATVYDKDYGADRTFQLYSESEVLGVLADHGLSVIPAEGEKLGGSHVLHGPQANGPLRTVRAQGRLNGKARCLRTGCAAHRDGDDRFDGSQKPSGNYPLLVDRGAS